MQHFYISVARSLFVAITIKSEYFKFSYIEYFKMRNIILRKNIKLSAKNCFYFYFLMQYFFIEITILNRTISFHWDQNLLLQLSTKFKLNINREAYYPGQLEMCGLLWHILY